MLAPALPGGGGAGRIGAMLFALLLGGCAGGHPQYSQFAPPDDYDNGSITDSHVHVPLPADYAGLPPTAGGGRYHPYGGNGLALSEDGRGCSIADRFDTRATLAYNFDERHQLGLTMSLNTHDGSPMGVSRAMVVFRYRFAPPKPAAHHDAQTRCRYDSHWQGLVGSSYNELFLRDNNSLWGVLKDDRLDFWNK